MCNQKKAIYLYESAVAYVAVHRTKGISAEVFSLVTYLESAGLGTRSNTL